jgi:hypothetical protein
MAFEKVPGIRRAMHMLSESGACRMRFIYSLRALPLKLFETPHYKYVDSEYNKSHA